MKPQEVDAIIESVKESVCLFCATRRVDPSVPAVCTDCTAYFMEQTWNMDDEPTAEAFLEILGLTEGCKSLGRLAFTDRVVQHELTDRMLSLISKVQSVQKTSTRRQSMLWTRYCAFYLAHTCDSLVARLGTGPILSFDCFIFVLSNLWRESSFTRFLLSDDPKAKSGNALAKLLSEQLILHHSRWEKELDMVPRPPVPFTIMRNTCLLLAHLLYVQVDKSAVVPLGKELRIQVYRIVERWHKRWPDDESSDESLGLSIRRVHFSLVPEMAFYEHARKQREVWEGLQTCARKGCSKTGNLYICAQCRGALYCSRQHQADDWNAEPLSHRQICWRPYF